MSKSTPRKVDGRNSNLLLRTTQQPESQVVRKEKEDDASKSRHATSAVAPLQKGHRFLDRYKGSPMGDEVTQYRLPRIVRAKHETYVEYWFRIPEDLRPDYNNRQWERYRKKEGIGLKNSPYTPEMLCAAIRDALVHGYNPFMEEAKFVREERKEITEPGSKTWTVQEAVIFYNSIATERTNNADSLAKMLRTTNRFLAWLTNRDFHHQPVISITPEHIEKYLFEMKKGVPSKQGKPAKAWTNKTFNNEKGFLSMMFNFFLKRTITRTNPVLDVKKLRVVNRKNKYYNNQEFELVRNTLATEDPTCFFAAELIYYLCIRSEKELSLLLLSHFDLENKRVNLPAENTKTQTDRSIPLADDLIPKIAELKKQYPGNYHVISVKRKSKFDAYNPPGKTPFASGFLSRRFSKIRAKLGLSQYHELYSFKHTRMLHLRNATNELGEKLSDGDIMFLTGHTDYQAFSQYMRDLALTGDADKINRLSRKF
jgi:integrase